MIKQFGNTHFLREPSLSTNSLNSEQYFHDSPLCPNFKYETPPPPLNIRGEENYTRDYFVSRQFYQMWQAWTSETYGPMAVSLVVKKYNWGNSKKPLKSRKNLKVFHACLRWNPDRGPKVEAPESSGIFIFESDYFNSDCILFFKWNFILLEKQSCFEFLR